MYQNKEKLDTTEKPVYVIKNAVDPAFRFLGDGLITVRDHDKWYKQRRIMDPAFSSLWVTWLMQKWHNGVFG